MKTVSQIIYNKLSKHVSTAYMFSGGSIMSLIDHFHPSKNINKLKYFVPTSEASAGFCSIGHNKSLNKLDSVIITTSGPGLTNILTPLTDANCDNIPFFVISGDVSTHMKGKHAFQEAPSIELTKPITTWNYNLTDPKETDVIFDYAFYLLSKGKQVHINIPKDILSLTIPYSDGYHEMSNFVPENNITETIEYCAQIINNAKNPVFYVGKGCNNASDELYAIANRANIPVTTTLHGLGAFDENNKLSLKMLGMHGSVRANMAIQNADCIICVGARFDDRTTGNINKYAPKVENIIHINTDPNCFNKVVPKSINILSDSKTALNELSKYIINNNHDDWLSFLNNYPIDFPYEKIGLKQQDILTIFNEELNKLPEIKNNSVITTGVGNHQMYTAQLITHTHSNRFLTSGSLGTMGCSNSMAIGAKIANSDKIVFSIDGDQSFNMLNDLKMIYNYNIPIKMIIMNDSCQSMVNVWEQLFYNNNITATISKNPNYELIAQAYNIRCITISDKMDKNLIRKLIKIFIEYDPSESIMLNCIIDSDYCLPLVPPGNGLDEMITFNNVNKYNLDTNVAAPS